VGKDDKEDEVTPREVGGLHARVDNIEITLTGIRGDVKDGFKSMNDTMNGLVTRIDDKVDVEVKAVHKRISCTQWRFITAIGAITASVTGWIIYHLTQGAG